MSSSHSEAKDRAQTWTAGGITYDNEKDYQKAVKAFAGTSLDVNKDNRPANNPSHSTNKPAAAAPPQRRTAEEYNQYHREKKRDEAEAYKQMRADLRANTSSEGERVVDERGYYQQRASEGKQYSGNVDKNAAIDKLMSTGKKFTSTDIAREAGGLYHNADNLYRAYGGKENYFDNHSIGAVGAENWNSRYKQDYIGTQASEDARQRGMFEQRNQWLNSDEFNSKYGQYDWAQKERDKLINNGQMNIQTFDDRASRLSGTQRGKAVGY